MAIPVMAAVALLELASKAMETARWAKREVDQPNDARFQVALSMLGRELSISRDMAVDKLDAELERRRLAAMDSDGS